MKAKTPSKEILALSAKINLLMAKEPGITPSIAVTAVSMSLAVVITSICRTKEQAIAFASGSGEVVASHVERDYDAITQKTAELERQLRSNPQ